MLNGRLVSLVCASLLLIGFSPPGWAAHDINHLHTFLNPSVLPSRDRDNFGIGLAWKENAIFIGARVADVGAVDTGILYQFDPAGNLIRTYPNPDPDVNDHFGALVAVVDDTLWVSANLDDTEGPDAGIVYLLDVDTGALLDTISSPNPTDSGRFGFRVIAMGSDVLVSAIGDMVDGTTTGAVYRFDGTTGQHLMTYKNPSPANGDRFGIGMDSLDCHVLIASQLDIDDGTGEGTAYLFHEDGDLLQTYPNPSPATSENYSFVSLLGGLVAVGALDNAEKAVDSGVLRIFEKTTGELLRSVYHPDEIVGTRFGSVTRYGSDFIVGAQASGGALIAGSAFVVNPETGAILGEFISPNSGVRDFFGFPVATQGEQVLVSGWGLSPTGILSGASYLYSATTDEVTIPPNYPASSPTASILPGSPHTGDDLVCAIDVDSWDPECQPVAYSYGWYRNGSPIAGETRRVLSGANTAVGDSIHCVVTPNDGEVDGATGETAAVLILEKPSAVETWSLYDASPAR